MALREMLLVTLRERFGEGAFREGAPPNPLAVFPARHPEVGDAKVWAGENMWATVAIGDIITDQFPNYDSHLRQDERTERVAREVVRFLEELFADRLLFWKSADETQRRGWRERGDAGHLEPLVLDDRTYRRYLWSGPLPDWRATPGILARGRIRNDREYQILLIRLNETGPTAFDVTERERVSRLIAEYELTLGDT